MADYLNDLGGGGGADECRVAIGREGGQLARLPAVAAIERLNQAGVRGRRLVQLRALGFDCGFGAIERAMQAPDIDPGRCQGAGGDQPFEQADVARDHRRSTRDEADHF
jgi:hypothetical protein